MVKRIGRVALISALLLISYLEMGVGDWTSDLTRDINRMTQNINEQVQHFTHNLQAQIQQNIEHSLRPALAQVNRAIANLPKDAQGRVITNSGDNIISVSSVNGISRIIQSGRTPEGEPYVRSIEERRQGNFLYHDEINFNPRTNVTEKIRWKLNLSEPNSTPEILTDEN